LTLPFAKMHGCGNDYVVIDGFRHDMADPHELARRMNDRRFGVGADGLLLALPSDEADFRMRMFNVDGSEAEMCGNGLRCLVKFVWERDLVPHREQLTVDTLAGRLTVFPTVEDERVVAVTVDMGRPRLERSEIPMRGAAGRVVDEDLDVGERTFAVTAVSMGNPHVVTWVDDVDALPLEEIGPLVEHHPAFPNRVNAEFVERLSETEVRQRTWERGCQETLACGTGACAVVVAGVLTARTRREILIHLRGGDLHIAWGEDDHVRLTGPAVEVFQGTWPRS
jgi:diaminopimelate epimerase